MLQRLDMFGIRLGLRYQQNQTYKTQFGAVITILISLMIMSQMFIVGRELYEKKNPDVIFTERYVEEPKRYDMGIQNFNIAFGVQDGIKFQHFIDESIYKVNAQQIYMKKIYNETTKSFEQKWDNKKINLQRCSENNFQVKESEQKFNGLAGLNNMYCIDQQNSEVFMVGDFSANEFGYLQVSFSKCNKDEDVNCQGEEKLQKALNSTFVGLYLNDIIVNPKEQYPFNKVFRDYFWYSSTNLPKEVTMNYRNIYVESDKGILFEEKSYERDVAIQSVNEQMIFGKTDHFFNIIIRFEKSKESVYYRKYKKIDSALAEVGGIAKALMIIGFFICVPFNQLHLHYLLAGQLFSFNSEGRQERIAHLRKSHSQKADSLPNLGERKQLQQASNRKLNEIQKQVSANNNTERNLNQDLTTVFHTQNEVQISKPQKADDCTNNIIISNNFRSDKTLDDKENKKQNDHQLTLSWSDFIRYYIWPWGKFQNKKQQLDFAIDKIYSHLDMLTITHKFLELERIKQLLFDENQIQLIQFLPKPNINQKNIEQNRTMSLSKLNRNNHEIKGKQNQVNLLMESCFQQDEEKKSKQAFLALKKIFSKPKLTHIDNKIIEMLDDSFLSCIEQHKQDPKQDVNEITFFNNSDYNKKEDKNIINLEDILLNQNTEKQIQCVKDSRNQKMKQPDQEQKEDLSYQQNLILIQNNQSEYNSFEQTKNCHFKQNDLNMKIINNQFFSKSQPIISESEIISMSSCMDVPHNEVIPKQLEDIYIQNNNLKFMKQNYQN